MKERVYRVASSRSFTRFLSIVAVAVVAFAALELVFVQQALAAQRICCSKTSTGAINTNDCNCDGSVTACSNVSPVTRKTMDTLFQPPLGKACQTVGKYGSASVISSNIKCVNANQNGYTELDSTSFRQRQLLFCEVTDSFHDDIGFCQSDITYSKAGSQTSPPLMTCVNNVVNNVPDGTSTATWKGDCSDVDGGPEATQLTVTGTLKCGTTAQQLGALQLPPNPVNFSCTTSGGCDCATSPDGCGLPKFCDGNTDCILNLGIAVDQGQLSPQVCSTLFPAVDLDSTVPGPEVPQGQVLFYSQKVQGQNCPDTPVLAIAPVEVQQYCSSGVFGDGSAAVNCLPDGPEPLTGLGLAESFVPIDVQFTLPQKLNLTCQNNDTWHFTFSATASVPNLNQIVVSTLAVEGVAGQVTSCDNVDTSVVPNRRTCHVNACQTDPTKTDIGTVACANRNADGTVNITVTGEVGDSNGSPVSNPISFFGQHVNKKTTGQCS
jgi:hypothetical protein